MQEDNVNRVDLMGSGTCQVNSKPTKTFYIQRKLLFLLMIFTFHNCTADHKEQLVELEFPEEII